MIELNVPRLRGEKEVIFVNENNIETIKKNGENQSNVGLTSGEKIVVLNDPITIINMITTMRRKTS